MHWPLGALVAIKILHVVLAASWLGAAVFGVFALRPVMMQTSPAARGEVMQRLMPASMKFFASIGGLTILSGLLLVFALRDSFSDLGDSWGRLVMASLLAAVAALLIAFLAIKKSFVRLGEVMKDARPNEPPPMLAMILQKRIAMAQMTNVVILAAALAMMVAANMGLQV